MKELCRHEIDSVPWLARVVNIVSTFVQVSNCKKIKKKRVDPKIDAVTELSTVDDLAKHSSNCLSGKSVIQLLTEPVTESVNQIITYLTI
jgi:hypothetical protein